MTTRDGYALDLVSPVRHVATEMDKASSDGLALSIEAMAATYQHTIHGDLTRIRQHEGAGNDYEARVWLIRRAVDELGRQAVSDGNGGYRLAKPLAELKYKGRKVRPAVRAGEETEKEILRDTYQNLASELRPFRVTVTGARSTRDAELTLHPLAHAIPRMTEKEFTELAADVKAHGVKLPLTVMGAKVIDGRHRLAVAAALNVPVRVTEFAGTEEEARHHIVSLNLVRRHLTMAQRGLIVREIFLPEAKAEVSVGRPKNDTKKLAQDSANIPAGKAAAVAAERSMGLANVRTVETMAPVDDAPLTRERIRQGEIKTATEARREALKETGSGEPEEIEPLESVSAYKRLGVALTNMRKAADAIKAGERGPVPPEKLASRVAEIRAELHTLEELLL